MKKTLLVLTFLTLCGCGILANDSKQSSQSEGCPQQPDVALDPQNVQEIALGNEMSTESGQAITSKPVAYIFEAEEGQKLSYKTDDNICLWVFSQENDLVTSNTLPKKGKYTIQVTPLKGSTTFDLEMGLDVTQTSNGNEEEENKEDNNKDNEREIVSRPAARPISQEQAAELVTKWQKLKPRLFSPPYDRSLGEELLTGKAYRDNIRKTDGTESSIDWLEDNDAYYTYGLQKIDSVKDFTTSGSQATIDVVVSEQRTLCLNGRASSDDNTIADQRVVRYYLQPDQGTWKIAEYKSIETISSSYNPAASCQINN